MKNKYATIIGVNCIDSQIGNILVDVYSTEDNYYCVKKCDITPEQAESLCANGSKFAYKVIEDFEYFQGRPKNRKVTLLLLSYEGFMKLNFIVRKAMEDEYKYRLKL